MIRFLIQNLIQKYLSKHNNVIVGTIPELADMVDDLRVLVTHNVESKGRAATIEQFDEVFIICVLFLCKSFFAFIYSNESTYLLGDFLNVTAEQHYVSAVIIQSFWREKYVGWQYARKQANLLILRSIASSSMAVGNVN